MGATNILIEGGSCTGKTTVADELQKRGFHVIHGDRALACVGDPLTGKRLEKPYEPNSRASAEWLHNHWIWPVSEVERLVAAQDHDVTFFCGASRNLRQVSHLFDRVFVLTIDSETLRQRLMARPAGEFGGTEIERELILELHRERRDVPAGWVAIDAAVPPAAVADNILLKCGLAKARHES